MRSVSSWDRRRLLILGACGLAGLGAPFPRIAAGGPLDAPFPLARQPLSIALNAVAVVGRIVLAVGERGAVLRSEDSGASWLQVRTPVGVTLTDVGMADELHGWAVGHMGVVLRTRDGGATWTTQMDGRQAASLALADAEQLAQTASASPELVSRRIAWGRQLVADGPDKPFLGLCVVDPRTAWIVGASNLVFTTSDGGDSWRPAQGRLDNPDAFHLYSIRKYRSSMYVAGEQGLAFRSDDGGLTFRALRTPFRGSFFGIMVRQDERVFLFGLEGTVIRSNDRGTTWTAAHVPQNAPVTAAGDLGNSGIVIGNQAGRLFLSRDGGDSFQPIELKGVGAASGFAVTANGQLIIAGERGITRNSIEALSRKT